MKSRSTRRCGSGGLRGPARPAPPGRRSRRPGSTPADGPQRVEVRRAERHDARAPGPAAAPPARARTGRRGSGRSPPRARPRAHELLQAPLEPRRSRRPSSRRSAGSRSGACGGRSGAATTPSVAICASPVRKPGISITGSGCGRLAAGRGRAACRSSDAKLQAQQALPPDRRERHRADPHDAASLIGHSVSFGSSRAGELERRRPRVLHVPLLDRGSPNRRAP